MKVLGIVHEHNATVCLMQDGRIVFCQSEERLNRIKSSSGFPHETLRYVYEHLASPAEIDLAVVFEKSLSGYLAMKAREFKPEIGSFHLEPGAARLTLRERLLRTAPGRFARRLKAARVEASHGLRQEAEAYFSKALRLDATKIRYVDHHLGHALSVFPNVAQWGMALIFTLDGFGDGLCGTVSLVDQGKLERLSASEERHSLGMLYWDSTLLMGMKGLEDEFKVMGLAPYSDPSKHERLLARLRNLILIDEAGEWKCAVHPDTLFDELERTFRLNRFDRIAGAVQALTEELITKWVSFWVAKTGCRNVALSGGVFMNVKAAHRVADLPLVDRLFVMPSAGDESCAIGSAVWGTLQALPAQALQPLSSLFLGMEFSEAEIEGALAEAGCAARYHLSRPENVHCEVARLLAENKIVARFAGRMEFGARALGNRSILANPSDLRNVQRLNSAIKNRDFWMPFAPSILEDDMPRYVKGHDRIFSPYMCVARDSTPLAQRDLVAAIHPRDLTLRPQAVRREWNPEFFEIIKTFKVLTGIGGVINTSFNLHGEPIVCSPRDAIDTFERSKLDYMMLGPFLLA